MHLDSQYETWALSIKSDFGVIIVKLQTVVPSEVRPSITHEL